MKTTLSHIQTEAHNLRDELSRKEASIQTSVVEKAVQERSLEEARQQIKMLSQQLEDASVQRVETESEVGMVKKRLEEKEMEIGRLTEEVSCSLCVRVLCLIAFLYISVYMYIYVDLKCPTPLKIQVIVVLG